MRQVWLSGNVGGLSATPGVAVRTRARALYCARRGMATRNMELRGRRLLSDLLSDSVSAQTGATRSNTLGRDRETYVQHPRNQSSKASVVNGGKPSRVSISLSAFR